MSRYRLRTGAEADVAGIPDPGSGIHRLDGQTRFAFRAFKTDPRISPNPKRSGFEIRLARIEAKLKALQAPFRIRKTEKGMFDLEVLGGFGFRESAPEASGSASPWLQKEEGWETSG